MVEDIQNDVCCLATEHYRPVEITPPQASSTKGLTTYTSTFANLAEETDETGSDTPASFALAGPCRGYSLLCTCPSRPAPSPDSASASTILCNPSPPRALLGLFEGRAASNGADAFC
jgi:hypothetical protein